MTTVHFVEHRCVPRLMPTLYCRRLCFETEEDRDRRQAWWDARFPPTPVAITLPSIYPGVVFVSHDMFDAIRRGGA